MVDYPDSIEDYTEWNFRVRIARNIGFKPRSMFTKDHLNSIYAYFKGEFLIDPDNIHKKESEDWVSLKEMRIIIASICDFHYDETKYGQLAGPKFNKVQLKQIFEKIQDNQDQRHWT